MKRLITAIICMTVLAACGGGQEGTKELSLGYSTRFSAKLGETRVITIESGNGSYTAVPEDGEILSLGIDGNKINITPLKEGVTTVTLSDKADKSLSFTVEVEKPYVLWMFANPEFVVSGNVAEATITAIKNDLKKKTTIEGEQIYQFVSGDENELIVYADMDAMSRRSVLKTGTYSFGGDYKSVTVSFGGDPITYPVYLDYGSYVEWMVRHYFTGDGFRMPEAENIQIWTDMLEEYVNFYPEDEIVGVRIVYIAIPAIYKNLG